jgi:glycosyltransferase involved in cell wall biosynthesis
MPGTLSLPALLALRRLMLRHSVSLVHTHSSVDSWLASVAAKSLHLPLVRSRHVSIPIRRRRALVYHLADRILTSGEHVKALVQAAGIPSVKIVSIPPGIDPTRFNDGVDGNAVRRELGLSGPLVGLVANIRGSKGHRYFLEAATRVLSKVPQTHFLIVGDGVGFDDVRRRIHAMGLEPHVLMTGFRRDVAEVMAALDVLVLPSIRSEATSQVIPQALAVGTPVVATTVGGSPEIIRDGETGRLVVPGDADALAEGILDLLLDPERARAMAVAGQSLVCERFTIDATMTATTGVYDELLARRRPPRR